MPTAHTFTSSVTFDAAVAAYRRVWVAVGEDATKTAGFDSFFTNIKLLLQRAEAFKVNSFQRNALLYRIGGGTA